MMDWTSEEGKKLLWQAYPLGCLPMRGVTTIGGYLSWGDYYWCNPVNAGNGPDHAKAEFFGVAPEDPHGTWVAKGLLLPHPDIKDPATWACLLMNLWTAMGGKPTCAGITLEAPSNYGEPWCLNSGFEPGRPDSLFLDLPVLYGEEQWWEESKECYPKYEHATQDPAWALVLSRIAVRKQLKQHEGKL